MKTKTVKKRKYHGSIRKGMKVRLRTAPPDLIGEVRGYAEHGTVVKVKWPGRKRLTAHDEINLEVVA